MAKPANWNGQLRSNEIFGALYNMIINQHIYADNIAGTYSELVDMMRTDGSLYGDTKLFYAVDVLKSAPFLADLEAANLLNIYRPEAPEVQAITIDQFRQISLTVDNYLTKRAWSTEGAFASFNSVILGMIRETKRIYDATLFNTYIGTAATAEGRQMLTVTLPIEEGNTEATNRLRAQAIATKIADTFVELKDVSRDFNDYGNMRSYREDDLIVVWNSEYVNEITKFDLPTLFHKEGLIDKFGQYTLPARYFGTVAGTSGTATASASNITVRSLIETDYVVSGVTYHVFPGELIPGGATYNNVDAYNTSSDIVCKIMHKRSVPFMSAMEVATSFFNPKSLTETHFLTFGYNKPQYLYNYPFITLTAVSAEVDSGDGSGDSSGDSSETPAA